MGIRSRLKTAKNIAAAPAVGAYKGLVKTGAAPAVGTFKGALRGDKSDIAVVGATAAAAIPVGRFTKFAIEGRGLATSERLRVAAQATVTRKPLFHGTNLLSAQKIAKEGFKGTKLPHITNQGPEVAYATPHLKVAVAYAKQAARQTRPERTGRVFGPARTPAVVVAKATEEAVGAGAGGLAFRNKSLRPARSISSRLASERGSLDLGAYMNKVRRRYDNARKNATLSDIMSVRAQARQAAANVPKGFIFEATTAKHVSSAKNATAFSDAGGTMATEAGTATRSIASIRSGQRQKAIVAGVAIDVRMDRGKKQPLLKGFYEQIKSEEGALRFPDKPGNAIRRMRARVMQGISGVKSEIKTELTRPKELEKKHAAVIAELSSSSRRANETSATTLKEIIVETHGEEALKWPLKIKRRSTTSRMR